MHLDKLFMPKLKVIEYVQAHKMSTVPCITHLENGFYLELFLKERHSVVGFYTDPLSISSEGQNEERFNILEGMLYSKSYISNVTR